MSAHDNWSDSDSEAESALTDVETNVELGIPNGEITSTEDLDDPMVSRIGGIPSFLSKSPPPFDSSHCKICASPAELLVQLWCPLQDNPYDRVLYVWGCSRRGCQKKDGSVRAWRALRYNETYAKKLAKQQAKAKARAEAQKKEKEKAAAPKAPVTASAFNPFAIDAPSDGFGFGDLGSNPFSSPAPAAPNEPSLSKPSPPPSDGGTEDDEDEDEDEDGADSVEDLSSSLARTALSSPWANAPSYQPLYLDTEREYLPPAPPTSKGLKKLVDEGRGAKNASAGGNEWGHEAYEKRRGVDEVFERFAKRVGVRGEQCVRYDRRVVPLFYQSTDETYKALHTIPAGTQVPVTGGHTLGSSTVGGAPSKWAYNPTAERLQPCAVCRRPTTTRSAGGERVFEFQLVPHLISALQPASGADLGSKKRVDVVEQLPGKGEAAGNGNGNEEGGATAKEKALERTGMEWGTVLVFTCRDNCCAGRVDDATAKECWQEELVLVQWEE